MKETLYHGYDAETLTLQYSPSLSVSDAPRHVERWARESAIFREHFVGSASYNVVYGQHEGEKLDIFSPASTDAPVHIYIHGGYWQRTDKSDYSYLAGALTDRGVCVVVPNYTLCPTGSVGGTIEEVRHALAWTWANIALYGGDPARIHVSGHSAGGHLAVMMALTNWPDLVSSLPVDLVKSALPISGVFDLEPLIHTPINQPLGLDIESAHSLSPIFMHTNNPVPVAFAVGGDESDEFHRQSVSMAARWRDIGGGVTHVECPGRHHFNVIDDLNDTSSALFRQATSFLGD